MSGDLPDEVAATYAALDELLSSTRSDEDFVSECQELVERLIRLGKEQDRESDQRWALWMAKNTTFGGDR